ncbi:MAG: hypothetical protein J0M24_18675 [Verrucomicrobia bacterium]|nr:hypothetical protein [Verrucomicrobiota bacterium]
MTLFLPWGLLVQGQGVAPAKEPARVIESAPVTVERGGDFRVVEWVTATTDESGETQSVTNRYTEVATGLHYRDEQGQLQETVAEFVAVPDGFVAARGPHQVALSTELTVPGAGRRPDLAEFAGAAGLHGSRQRRKCSTGGSSVVACRTD